MPLDIVATEMTNKRHERIAFIHPDLGIGGAERLVVDAAVGLQESAKHVDIYTSHCDQGHCFDEVRDGTLKVTVYGDFLPTHLFHKFHILFSILRQAFLVLALVISGRIKNYDYFIVDQLSFCIPLIALFGKDLCRILFYCHFPDQLLAQRGSFLKSMYRKLFDFIEEWTMGASDKIVVNLNFTKKVFHQTFTTLNTEPGVIYPCVNMRVVVDNAKTQASSQVLDFFKESRYFVSINRFERKKNIELAIYAFAAFKSKVGHEANRPRMVIAGGFDLRVMENVNYMSELESICKKLQLQSFVLRGKLMLMPPATDVLFLPSISSAVKHALLDHAECLLYTPANEHFGIVPIESMLHKTPVLATNTGGPLETIISYSSSNINEATGYNVAPDATEWARIMAQHYLEITPKYKQKMGENGYQRTLQLFSREKMSLAFISNLESAASHSERQHRLLPLYVTAALGILVSVLVILVSRVY